MTLLHAQFQLRNQQAFQRLLDPANDKGNNLSTSGGKSWQKGSMTAISEVNSRDWLGRTVLHLACADIGRLEYVRILLRNSSINVNIQDTESHWTPLHRALYHANLAAASLLLQRPDIDTSLKDYEGYTAFDLYNLTVDGTTPGNDAEAELFTWGANRCIFSSRSPVASLSGLGMLP